MISFLAKLKRNIRKIKERTTLKHPQHIRRIADNQTVLYKKHVKRPRRFTALELQLTRKVFLENSR